MEYQAPESKRKKGRPLPRRGQVKARIFEGIIRAVIPKALKDGEKTKKDGHGSSVDTTPALSGYTSNYDDG